MTICISRRGLISYCGRTTLNIAMVEVYSTCVDYPHVVDPSIDCGGGKVLVRPGDIIMADDGGAIVIPPRLAPKIIEIAGERDEHEVFVRMKLREGGELGKYYPFNDEGRREYEEWLAAQG